MFRFISKKTSDCGLGNTGTDVGLMWRHRLRNCIQRDAAEAWIKDARYGHTMEDE